MAEALKRLMNPERVRSIDFDLPRVRGLGFDTAA